MGTMVEGGEWIVIVLVALVVFGPERLPELARKLGGWAQELRTAARDMRKGLEAEVSDIQKAKAELTDPVKEVRKAVRDTARLASEANPTRLEWNGPKPLSGPTPDQALADLDRIELGEALDDAPPALPPSEEEPQPQIATGPDRSPEPTEEPT